MAEIVKRAAEHRFEEIVPDANMSAFLRSMCEDYNALTETIDQTSKVHFPPNAQKRLRRFTASEASELIGVSTRYLGMIADEIELETERDGRNARSYSLSDMNTLRNALAEKAGYDTPKGIGYMPRRRDGDPMRVVALSNFKGGSAKSTTAIHLAQHLALRGYRVLLLDLDPQGSASAMFGVPPEKTDDDATSYAFLRSEDPRPISEVALKTYFEGLDLVPGGRSLSYWEFDAPRVSVEAKYHQGQLLSRVAELKERLSSGLLNIEQSKNVKAEIENLQQEVRDLWFDRAYFARLSWALQDVKDDYDIVVCDTAPNLGYVTNAAMFAADHLVVTIHPQWLDCESMAQYLYTYLRQQQEFEQAMTSISGANYEVAKSLHYLITRHDTNSSPEALVIGMLRNHLSNVLHNVMVKSSAIAEAGTYQQSLYEADRGRFTRKTFERVMEAMKAVNQEIEHIITSSWGRK